MMNVRILFLMLSVVTTFYRNDVSAANPNNIEYLLETLIKKVDALEKKMEKQVDDVNDVVSKTAFQVEDLVTDASQTNKTINNLVKDVETVKKDMASSIYNIMSDEVKKSTINVEDVSRALAYGYHFVGNGYYGQYNDFIRNHISFSQCVDFCKKKRDTDGEAWNSFYWQGYNNYCVCFKGERGHTPNKVSVHFRI